MNWFSEQHNNRRLYPRRQAPFRAWLRDGEGSTPLAGVDLSASGLGVLSLVPLPWGDARFSAEIEGRRIDIHARTMWTQEGEMEKKHVWRAGFRTTSIAAEDWKTILDYCNAALPDEQRITEPPLVRLQADDIARLLPEALRLRIVDLLEESGRVTVFAHAPNLQYYYGGVVLYQERMLHRLHVGSTMIDPKRSQVHSFETKFYFDDDLTDIVMDEAAPVSSV